MRGLLTALLLAFCCHGTALAICGDGVLDPGETCDDGNLVDGDCCSSVCQIEPAATVCRSAAGDCDVPESCDGVTDTCPPDLKSNAPCRAAAGACDISESCDGVSNDCPPDAFQPATVECRSSIGACDAAENCTGASASCPTDAFEPSTTVCRSSEGMCDPAETCTGTSPTCPPDLKSSAVCRPSAGACDVPESCDGVGNDCPTDLAAQDGTPCNDGDVCTRIDACHAGTCVGSDPIVCPPLDGCHVVGSCNPTTGICSNPDQANNASCNDGNPCTTADSCQGGVCRGFPVTGCCRVDRECDDGFTCTEDHCVGNVCTHAHLDERCGAAGDCAALMCMPEDPAAASTGCVARPLGEGGYCGDDGDPCTIDACRSGTCRHEDDGSGAGCAALAAPYHIAADLLSQTTALETAIQAAIAGGCPAGKVPTCDVVPGEELTRLITLLQSAELDLRSAALALAGRLTASTSPGPERDPLMRARVALGLVAETPGDLRAFLATLAQARPPHIVAATFARGRRMDCRHLLGGMGKLRQKLQRVVTRRRSFAQ